jgi:hypothetical protein
MESAFNANKPICVMLVYREQPSYHLELGAMAYRTLLPFMKEAESGYCAALKVATGPEATALALIACPRIS